MTTNWAPYGTGRFKGGIVGVALLLAVVASLAFVFIPLGSSVSTGSSPGSLTMLDSGTSSSSGPTVSLLVDRAIGTAPFFANVTASASGGTPPYNLTFCPSGTGSTCEHDSSWGGTPWKQEVSFPNPGNYTISASAIDSSGSATSASAQVEVLAIVPLVATFTEAATSGTAPFTDSFQTLVSGGTGPYTATWSFGDGTVLNASPGQAVEHTYTAAGQYAPKLTVADSQGHSIVHLLPSVRVLSPVSPTGPTVAGVPSTVFTTAISAVVVIALAAGIGTYAWRERQVRKEAAELVNQLWEGDPGDPEDDSSR